MLAWPTLLEQLLQTLVQYIDAAMVGKIGPAATATVGISTSVTWLVNGPLFALGIGFMAFISRNMGAESYEEVRKASSQSVLVTIAAGLTVGAVTLLVSPFLPIWMGAEEAIPVFVIFCSHLPADAFPRCHHHFRCSLKSCRRYQNAHAGKYLYEHCEYLL